MIESRTYRSSIQSSSESDTERIGAEIGRRIDSAVCISLVGSLGAGKSVLARGICRGLGVGETVVSPSFMLCEEYEGRVPIIHVDLYRLEHESEVEELGLYDEMRDKVIVAEWGDRSDFLHNAADVVIELHVTGSSQRLIDIRCEDRWASICRGIES